MSKVRKAKNFDLDTALAELRKKALRCNFDHWDVEMAIFENCVNELSSLETADPQRIAAQDELLGLLSSYDYFNSMVSIYLGSDGDKRTIKLLRPIQSMIKYGSYDDDTAPPVMYGADGDICIIGDEAILRKVYETEDDAIDSWDYNPTIVVLIPKSASTTNMLTTLKRFQHLILEFLEKRSNVGN